MWMKKMKKSLLKKSKKNYEPFRKCHDLGATSFPWAKMLKRKDGEGLVIGMSNVLFVL